MKLPRIVRRVIRPILIVIVLFIQSTHIEVRAMGRKERNTEELMKNYRDSGVIGEKKTRVAKPNTGVRIYRGNESFVTPLVIGDEALFGSEFGNSYHLGYAFRFACLGWRYNIKAYLVNPGAEERISSPVDLESPDKKTRVNVKLIDVAFSAAFNHPLTEEQIQQQRAAQDKLDREYQRTEAIGIAVLSRYVPPYPDPLSHEERILAGKEVITRLLAKGVNGYKLREADQIRFSVEQVSGKKFVRGQANLYGANVQKKCVVWALNISGYRLKDAPDKRRGNTWVCQVISDPLDFLSVEAKAHRIIETLKFASGDQNVYPDLRD
jgi:hypothetical protein